MKWETYLRVALLQLAADPSTPRGNVDRAVAELERLDGASVDLVCLPELCTSGYCARDRFRTLAESVPGPTTELLSSHARRLRAFLLFGLPERDEQTGVLYNTAVWITPQGRVGARYRKIHLATEREKRYFQPGRDRVLTEVNGIKAGVMICYDLGYFPELSRAYALQGAGLLLAPSAWGDSYSSSTAEPERARLLAASAHRLRVGSSARAFENGVFVVTCNRTGREYDSALDEYVEFVGQSCIVAPSGEAVVTMGSEEGVLLSEIDVSALATFRDGPVDALRDRRPETY